ncbi:DUF1656 domain-containing protein [Methylobacterium nigriterrae]|uniref:DUF1656 domain-containing protein n=1 Tax=Methylobacterium nigriterrae TaxID=3127512 RepID=UPI0030138867
MSGDLDLYGIFMPSLAAAMLAAFLIGLPVRGGLARIGLYRLVWHRPLFDLALYVLLLGGIVTLLPQVVP